MFKRNLQIRLVKGNSPALTNSSDDTFVGDSMYIVHETAKKVALITVGVLAAYIVMDTGRRVVDNRTKKF